MRTFFVALAAALLGLPGAGWAETLYYIHVDHLNTPRLAVSEDGVERWRWDNLEPFGENSPIEVMGTEGYLINLPLRFPGQYFDKETNTHYNMARDYDPAIGRYIQSDPIGLAGGLNTYLYVESNPISYTDPEGLQIRIPRSKIPGFPGTSSGGGRSSDSTGSRELDEALGLGGRSGSSASWSDSSSEQERKEKERAECEAKCDRDIYDPGRRDCSRRWKDKGRDGGEYFECMEEVRKRYLKCIQNCCK